MMGGQVTDMANCKQLFVAQEYFHGQEQDVGLTVRGGLYEADLKQRRLKACYWPEASHRILRGTWFVEKSPDWVPLKVG